MRACPDREERLVARAAGTLEAAEAAELDAHVAACAGCRAELAELGATLAAVALPPLDARERARVTDVLPRVLRAAEARRPRRWVWAASMVGAAAAAVLAVVGVTRMGAHRTQAAVEITEADVGALEDWALADDPLPEDPATAELPESFGEL